MIAFRFRSILRLAIGLGLSFFADTSVASDVAPLTPVENLNSKPDSNGRPLWQFGIGGGAGAGPHYPASDQSSLKILAAPTFRYRGRIMRADDDGTRARIVRFENSEVDVSGAASFPVSSSDNNARRGMRQLDWIGEVGPRLVLKWRLENAGKIRGDLLRLTFPLRTVASSDGSYLAHRGFNFQPGLSWQRVLNAPTAVSSEISVELDASMSFIDATLGNYFFGVSKADETPTRSAYEAAPGLLGVTSGLTLIVSPKDLINNGSAFFVGLRNTTTTWSANRASSLHRSDQQFAFFAGFNILWFNSDAREEPRTP